MKSNDFEEAVKCYSEAIELSQDSHILYSNRSAAYLKLEKFQDALLDAEKTIELKEDWPKVSHVKAAADFFLSVCGIIGLLVSLLVAGSLFPPLGPDLRVEGDNDSVGVSLDS